MTMVEEDWRYVVAAAVARIEQKVDGVNMSLNILAARIDTIENRVWDMSGTKLGTATLMSIMVVIATIAAAVGTMFPHIFNK
jgi:hypothetical protein